MKNRIVALLIPFTIIAFLWSCGSNQPPSDDGNNIIINDSNDDDKEEVTNGEDGMKEEVEVVEEEPIDPEQLAKAKEIIASVSDADIAAVDTKKLFKLTCSSCHGIKGDLKSNGSKDLTKSDATLDESVAQINFGKGLMLPYESLLSKAEIVAIAKYTESLRK